MIYIEQTTDKQNVLIPKEERIQSGLHLVLKQPGATKPIFDNDIVDKGNFLHYFHIELELPSSVGKGEYTYILTAYGKTLSTGVAWIAEPKVEKAEYKKNSKVKQYE